MTQKPVVLLADAALAHHSTIGNRLGNQADLISMVSLERLEGWLESQGRRVDMVILSIDLPGLGVDGFERYLAGWAQHASRADIGLILLGPDNPEFEVRALEAGAIYYLPYPFNEDLMAARLQRAMLSLGKMRYLRAMGMTDGMTGVANRRHFEEFLANEWRWAQRNHESLGVLMMDIDHFKLYNDHYGHVQGDECITSVARTLAGCIMRPHDLFARYGGEEFAAVLFGVNKEGLEVVATRMLDALRDLGIPHQHSPVADKVTVSIGGTCVPSGANCTPLDMVETADFALYEAKTGGRNRFVYSNLFSAHSGLSKVN